MTALEGSYIDGSWRHAGDQMSSTNPARPDEEVVRFAIADGEAVDEAFAATQRSQPGWESTPASARGAIVRKVAKLLEAETERFALLLTKDQGKTLDEGRGEVSRAVETLHFHAAQAWAPAGESYSSSKSGERVRVVRRPVGTVVVITPFNFPLVISAWKLGPAMVHGNSVVWKPAEAAPAVTFELARLFEQAGLPPGVLNLVAGPPSTGSLVTGHGGYDAITFTGSVEVGRVIESAAAPHGARVQLELGGHNPAVVLDDADLDVAARECISGAMLGAGQKCTSTRRIIVVKRTHDEFVNRLIAVGGRLVVGDGQIPGVHVGPVISRTAQENVTAAIELAIAEGADAQRVGVLHESTATGHFVQPTILLGAHQEMTIARHEVFGPVTSVIVVDDADEAFSVANATRYGLSASVFTTDRLLIERAERELDCGVLHINNQTTGAEPHAPFGARRMSSSANSRIEQGHVARDFYTWTKTVYDQ